VEDANKTIELAPNWVKVRVSFSQIPLSIFSFSSFPMNQTVR
jgi:hypothetical protein